LSFGILLRKAGESKGRKNWSLPGIDIGGIGVGCTGQTPTNCPFDAS
jgi:hypothetical protein